MNQREASMPKKLGISRSLIMLMSIATGVTVASLSD